MKTASIERALDCIPDGSCTLSKRPAAFPSGCPVLALAGDGPYLIADDGAAGGQWLDWMCALGALTVGHGHPKVVEAVTKQLQYSGAIFSLPSMLEGHVAERLCQRIPAAKLGQIKFVKTGSEACAGAVRIARAATGRDTILAFKKHYHGWHDWWAAKAEKHPGVPDFMEQGVLFVDGELLPQAIWEERTAAVICEPERLVADYGVSYLPKLMDTARKAGALVIFDETLSGGRLAFGGVSDFYNLIPDLAIYGKALGGGLPLAFIAGRRDVMQHAWPVSGTFSGDALALAACNAMIDIYETEHVIEKLWLNGTYVYRMLQDFALDHKALGMTVHGQPPRFWVDFGPHVRVDERGVHTSGNWNGQSPPVDRRLFMSVVVQQAVRRGVLVHPAVFFANAAMTTSQVEESMEVFEQAFTFAAEGVSDGTLAKRLDGEPYQDSVR